MKKILWVFCIYSVVNGCPPDWLNLGFEGCFHFASEVSPYGLNYYQSQEYCNSLHRQSFLAEIPNEDTQYILANYANELDDCFWWIGAQDFFQVKNQETFATFFFLKNIFRKEIGYGIELARN